MPRLMPFTSQYIFSSFAGVFYKITTVDLRLINSSGDSSAKINLVIGEVPHWH